MACNSSEYLGNSIGVICQECTVSVIVIIIVIIIIITITITIIIIIIIIIIISLLKRRGTVETLQQRAEVNSIGEYAILLLMLQLEKLKCFPK